MIPSCRLRPCLLAVASLALFVPSLALAQGGPWTLREALDLPASVKLTGSVRARYETIDGQVRPGLPASETVYTLRSTLFAEYRRGPLRFGGELYDSRAYGADPGSAVSTNEVNALEPVQAYVAADIAEPFGEKSKLTVQAGRFTMNLGSRRLVAVDDYRNTTNGYTGLRADLGLAGGLAATAFVTAPQVRLPDAPAAVLDNAQELDRESDDLVIWGALVARPLAGMAVEAGYYGLREEDAPGRPTRDRDLSTLSVRVVRNPSAGAIDFEIEAMGQTGDISASAAAAAAKLRVSASFLHAEAGYQFTDPWKTNVSLEYDRASGDDGGPDYGRFDTLFGMRRADLAPSGLYNAIGRANLQAPGVRVEVTPIARLDAFIAWRRLALDSSTDSFSTTGVRDATGASGRDAGDQIDARVRYWLIPGSLRFEADYVRLARGPFLTSAPNAPATGDNSQYLSLNLGWTF